MHAELTSLVDRDNGSIGAWSLLTGGSIGIVMGFGADLLRFAAFRTRQVLANQSSDPGTAPRDWHCPRTCSAGGR